MFMHTHFPLFKPLGLSVVDVYHSARVNDPKDHLSTRKPTYEGGIGTLSVGIREKHV